MNIILLYIHKMIILDFFHRTYCNGPKVSVFLLGACSSNKIALLWFCKPMLRNWITHSLGLKLLCFGRIIRVNNMTYYFNTKKHLKPFCSIEKAIVGTELLFEINPDISSNIFYFLQKFPLDAKLLKSHPLAAGYLDNLLFLYRNFYQSYI